MSYTIHKHEGKISIINASGKAIRFYKTDKEANDDLKALVKNYLWEQGEKAENLYGVCGCGYQFKDGDENKYNCPNCGTPISLFQPGV